MATTTRTQVEQDMTRHTLGHIFTKLKGQRRSRTTFVIVEGSDDLAFYGRYFNKRVVSAYYSTKMKDDGTVDTGGCEELQHIVKTVLDDGHTNNVIGIMDTDYRKYINGYSYPQNIFHTDCRDMEMTVFSTPSVRLALSEWINGFDNLWNQLVPVLRHTGTLRILNDKFRLGCNFKSKCKINRVFDEQSHTVFADWKQRYDKAFLKSCMKNRKQTFVQKILKLATLCIAKTHQLFTCYSKESVYDICHGHDTIQLLSMSLVRTHIFSELAIWEKCFDAYTAADFARTRLYADINAWQKEKGLSLFKVAVAA